MNKLTTRVLLPVSLAVVSITSYAAEDRIMSGPLHTMDLKNSRLVIDDTTQYLAPGYVVKNSKGEVISAFSLNKDQVVKYKINADGKITEIIVP